MIFCCGMPRSGGTLLYQIVKEVAREYKLPGSDVYREALKIREEEG